MDQDYTADSFFNGRLRVCQSRDGYRFAIDSVLLADFCRQRASGAVLDIGAGCGIISLLLAWKHADICLTAVEVQAELAELAILNVRQNRLEDRITVVHKDIREFNLPVGQQPFDGIVANPPYRKPCSGRINPKQQQALARHEIMITLDILLERVRALLRTAGWFAMIYPAERMAELVEAMRRVNIEPKRLRPVYSRIDSSAKLIMVEGVKAGRPGVLIDPPLIIYDRQGCYTKEARNIMFHC